MYAIVKTGSKQYRVEPGTEFFVEKLAGAAGDSVNLQALCVVDGASVMTEAAALSAHPVTATILEQTRGPKQIVFKFKKRKNYKKKQGHRQYLTRLRVESIGDAKAEPHSSVAPKDEAVAQAEVVAEELDELVNDVEMADIEEETAETAPASEEE